MDKKERWAANASNPYKQETYPKWIKYCKDLQLEKSTPIAFYAFYNKLNSSMDCSVICFRTFLAWLLTQILPSLRWRGLLFLAI